MNEAAEHPMLGDVDAAVWTVRGEADAIVAEFRTKGEAFAYGSRLDGDYTVVVGRWLPVPSWQHPVAVVAHDEWPVHQPEAHDAPIPGRQWYSGCEPGGDFDSETGRYHGTGPRVNPVTGVCEGCGQHACRECGRESCPDHHFQAAA